MTSQVAITLLKSLEQSLDDYCELNDEGKTAFSMAISALELFGNSEQLPSAQSQKGKWIFIHPLQADDKGAYMCSNCQRGDWDIKPTDKYCKFCGCRMEEGDSDE